MSNSGDDFNARHPVLYEYGPFRVRQLSKVWPSDKVNVQGGHFGLAVVGKGGAAETWLPTIRASEATPAGIARYVREWIQSTRERVAASEEDTAEQGRSAAAGSERLGITGDSEAGQASGQYGSERDTQDRGGEESHPQDLELVRDAERRLRHRLDVAEWALGELIAEYPEAAVDAVDKDGSSEKESG